MRTACCRRKRRRLTVHDGGDVREPDDAHHKGNDNVVAPERDPGEQGKRHGRAERAQAMRTPAALSSGRREGSKTRKRSGRAGQVTEQWHNALDVMVRGKTDKRNAVPHRAVELVRNVQAGEPGDNPAEREQAARDVGNERPTEAPPARVDLPLEVHRREEFPPTATEGAER
jgi:hypothetical protein